MPYRKDQIRRSTKFSHDFLKQIRGIFVCIQFIKLTYNLYTAAAGSKIPATRYAVARSAGCTEVT